MPYKVEKKPHTPESVKTNTGAKIHVTSSPNPTEEENLTIELLINAFME